MTAGYSLSHPPILRHLHALVLQQPALAFQPAAVLHQRAAGADQAVTRQHDANRIGAIGVADGTRSSSTPHPSVIIGNKSSVRIGPGVFVGQGKGMVPLDDPNAPNKTRCAILDGVSYCY